MDTIEIVLCVFLGIAILLGSLFFYFAISTGGIKAFVIYILFPLFVISFLVGIVLLLQLIIKLNDKLDNSTNGLNKKIDTNNFMIKDSIVNVDDFLQNVDYTVIIEDRNIQIDPNNPEDYGIPFRYQTKLYEPSLVIPGITGPKELEELIEENTKLIIVENDILKSNDEFSVTESLSVDETLEKESLPDSLSINETINEDHDIDCFYDENDNLSIVSNNYIGNLSELNPLHEEFLDNYDLF